MEIECFEFLVDRVRRAYLIHRSVDLQSVVIHDHNEVIQFAESGKHGSFPYLSFLNLSISEQCIHTVIVPGKFGGQCHADCCGNSLS